MTPPQRPRLPDVTLVAVTSVAISATLDALHASMRQADFGEVLLLSDRPPAQRDANSQIVWRPIEKLASRADYSRFMLRELSQHIGTSHALCVQWDGFVLNGRGWDPDFLRYDYIGAVWPHLEGAHRVGNGGFSLRSRRLLEACKTLPFESSQAEDLVIARLCRRELEEQGIRFAPEEVASRFAYERTQPSGQEFGFHGAFNLVRIVPPREALSCFRSLEAGVLTRGEHLELLRWALASRRFRLALRMMQRLPRARQA